MSITMHTGRPGTGKTYCLTKNALEYLKNDIPVWSNYKIRWEGYDEEKEIRSPIMKNIKKGLVKLGVYEWKKVPKNRLGYWKKIPDLYGIKEGVIIMDEAHVYFNSRRWKDLPEEMERKLAQHRKHGLHIEGTVQAIQRIDTIFRELVDFWYVYENSPFWFTKWEFDIDQDKQKKYPLSRKMIWKSKKIYNAYDTFEEIENAR